MSGLNLLDQGPAGGPDVEEVKALLSGTPVEAAAVDECALRADEATPGSVFSDLATASSSQAGKRAPSNWKGVGNVELSSSIL